jgi:hypothetical protein
MLALQGAMIKSHGEGDARKDIGVRARWALPRWGGSGSMAGYSGVDFGVTYGPMCEEHMLRSGTSYLRDLQFAIRG